MTNRKFELKTSILITAISSTLIMYMIFSSISIDYVPHFFSASLVQTNYRMIEPEIECPPITRKLTFYVLNMFITTNSMFHL